MVAAAGRSARRRPSLFPDSQARHVCLVLLHYRHNDDLRFSLKLRLIFEFITFFAKLLHAPGVEPASDGLENCLTLKIEVAGSNEFPGI